MRQSVALKLAVIFLLVSFPGMASAGKSKTGHVCNCRECKYDAASKQTEKHKCACERSGENHAKCKCGKPAMETGVNSGHVCNHNGNCKCNLASDSPRKCGCNKEKKKAI